MIPIKARKKAPGAGQISSIYTPLIYNIGRLTDSLIHGIAIL
jgi:hypothetical protein